jgi:23S rRNA (pseudouridine1915-N3)-methyltransferase
MRIVLAAVGKAKGGVAAPIHEYEARVKRYFSFSSVEVKEEPARSGDVDRVRTEEGKRLLARVTPHLEIVALHREGQSWTSVELAGYLSDLALHGGPGAAFLIGGAYGLSYEVLASARHRLSLSGFTLPHDLARLFLVEQLYRAGTITRGEPYHKARSAE